MLHCIRLLFIVHVDRTRLIW